MDVKNMLETLMYLHNNLLFVVDIKNKKVNNIYKGSTLLKQEASFEETCDIFQQTFDLIDTFKPKLMRFLTNLEPQDDPFDLAINYTKIDSSQTTILYKGLKLDDKIGSAKSGILQAYRGIGRGTPPTEEQVRTMGEYYGVDVEEALNALKGREEER